MLVLPPVPCMPNIGLMYALSAGANSILIFDQSASSSSARSIGSDVVTPCPISERSTITSTLSSGLIRSQAFGAKVEGYAMPRRPPTGRWNPMTRPAPATVAVCRNSRLVTSVGWATLRSRRTMDGGANALIGPAAANVRHGGVDIRVGRMRILGEQRSGRHDLARLAVAALRHVLLDPRLLHRLRAILREAFDGRHLFPGDGRDGQHAGARGDAVQVDGARAALRDAAAELRAGEAERVPQHPEQGRVGRDVHGLALAVDGETDRGHERASPRRMEKTCTGGHAEGRGLMLSEQ